METIYKGEAAATLSPPKTNYTLGQAEGLYDNVDKLISTAENIVGPVLNMFSLHVPATGRDEVVCDQPSDLAERMVWRAENIIQRLSILNDALARIASKIPV